MHHLDVRTARKLQGSPTRFAFAVVVTLLAGAVGGCPACGPPEPLVLLPLPPGAANVARSRDGNPPPGVSLAMDRGHAVVGDAVIRSRIAVVRAFRDGVEPPPAPPPIAELVGDVAAPREATVAAVESGAALVPQSARSPIPPAPIPWVDADEDAEAPDGGDEAAEPATPSAAEPVALADVLAPPQEVSAIMERPSLVCVNVNIASRSQLETLPRIGPAMADRIVQARPFNSVDALTRVRGIGPATLDVLRPLVCV